MPDSQTAVAALQAGEIDFYEIPQPDFMDQLESDKNIKIEVLNPLGQVGHDPPQLPAPALQQCRRRARPCCIWSSNPTT